ncbi:MAG: hypothetical protein IKA95_05350 [Clostridia bacterium]|nr:hypothetical protein [Clostridia bacterium]
MINKKKILASANSDELKLVLSHACDLYTKAEFSGRAFFTKFLTPSDACEIKARFPSESVSFFGGYDDAERVVASFGEVQDKSEYPIKVIDVRQKGGKELSHRDYLGTVLSLGIGREMVGDIIVREGGAYVFCLADIAPFIADSLCKIGGAGVRTDVLDDIFDVSFERKYETRGATVSSLRLDCVVSAACGKSRAASSELVARSLVSVNYKEANSVSLAIKDGDILTVRGHGKFLIKTDSRLTRKGRIYIDILKYV